MSGFHDPSIPRASSVQGAHSGIFSASSVATCLALSSSLQTRDVALHRRVARQQRSAQIVKRRCDAYALRQQLWRPRRPSLPHTNILRRRAPPPKQPAARWYRSQSSRLPHRFQLLEQRHEAGEGNGQQRDLALRRGGSVIGPPNLRQIRRSVRAAASPRPVRAAGREN